ncbi:MAG: hypothetical protein COA58_05895 [Bacteroidetes bacterium]|nr:MAG: hypothetical protein COA58_05895 [Bacteroidota bacterium]
MKNITAHSRTRAQESTGAIQRLFVTMRHLFNRGFYKPMGVSGETLREALLTLQPEIYGSIAKDKVELAGLLYVIDRLPIGIEECRFINLTSDEGFKDSHFETIIPPKRRRNCYRIDADQMNIEITRGRSEIYDILTHLTFLFIESYKIMKQVVINDKGDVNRDWQKLEEAVMQKKRLSNDECETALSHTASILGRTFKEVSEVYEQFSNSENPERFLHIVYWLGKKAIDGHLQNNKRTITFSSVLRERLGQHIHGEIWANNIKEELDKHNLLKRPIHIVSANMHSVLNTLYAPSALKNKLKDHSNLDIFEELSSSDQHRGAVKKVAQNEGLIYIKDESGTNINVQIFDTAHYKSGEYAKSIKDLKTEDKPVIVVMDYAFGEQAYETMDELLKPFKPDEETTKYLNIVSISVMGKAGILEGGKSDIMIPSAHIFEGTADNYPLENGLSKQDLEGHGIGVYDGAMVSVLGTSLQNRDVLRYFHRSTWGVIGLEMEGAHYQKAIQAASKIRKSISPDVVVNYAYYASDNPLETGSTLASGGLGTSGVKPTYLITEKILDQIFSLKA